MTEKLEEAVDDLRQKGNHEFQQGNLDHASALYTAAIEQATAGAKAEAQSDAPADSWPMKEALIVNLCNRSACYFQMEEYEKAKEDAVLAWKVSQQSNVKAAYRLGKTCIALNDFQGAIQALDQALIIPSLQPKEQDSLNDLLKQARTKAEEAGEATTEAETTIKGVNRPVSIREFTKGETLGVGNFSEIIVVQHKQTHEYFALKILEKKTAVDLAKRQHPNVYNEIAMEARVLLQRLPRHERVITMYHSFMDYNNLYYLMDLHNVNTDLWTQIRYQTKMVGAHESQVKRWMLQLIDAIEHIHSHGIVHRDLKPENVLLNERNQVVVLDFGTAKDLILTDLNGPEFVGTPDFMPPEAVTGVSGMPKPGEQQEKKPDQPAGADHTADLWALGAMTYIMLTGSCPFWSPSPYLTFLRIKRGLLPRHEWGLPDEETWDFIIRLMQVSPEKRLGANCFKVEKGKVTVKKGYDILRNHDFFKGTTKHNDNSSPHVIPSLQDLCLRGIAEQAQKDAIDLDICDQHPPGDGSRHDLCRLSDRQRKKILHILDKLKVFKDGDETRVLQRFFKNDIDYIKSKVRAKSRDFVGLTQMNDDEYKPQSQRGSADPYAKKEEPEPTKVVVLQNPNLLGEPAETSEEKTKALLKGWKNCVAHINKQRPKAVVVGGHISPKYWKFLARIRDSIPVIWNDGSVYYSFWLHGFQGLVLQSNNFGKDSVQMKWLQEQMEQTRMAKNKVFAFCDCDPRELPPLVLKRLTRGRVLCLYGNSKESVDYTITYEPNESLDDNTSVKSTDSEEDQNDGFTMRVVADSANGMHWLTVDETDPWMTSFESIDMPS